MWNVADVLLRGLRKGAVCVLSRRLLPVGCRARLNARVEPGALNAGQARILAGDVVDGFGQSLFLPVFWDFCFEGFFFIGLR